MGLFLGVVLGVIGGAVAIVFWIYTIMVTLDCMSDALELSPWNPARWVATGLLALQVVGIPALTAAYLLG